MTQKMQDIFLKNIDRAIDGVIKADDESSLAVELDEYVITDEIARKLEIFLDAYNNYSTANGVWVSGFFGSGKSHLLKMLAYVLENHIIDGKPAFDYFKEKPEIASAPMLSGALHKAISIPSRSILFNIDQKADIISKDDVDALLGVFQKVFDEMCGYYGKQAHVAQFERDLDSRGEFQAFQDAYADVAGKPWTEGRTRNLLEKANIAKAYAQATGTEIAAASDILGQYRKEHKVSIEDFAETVKAWLDTQGPTFRLNFFVDEVGQYIADNIKLMTNLQTVAESLNTKCKGRAWVIVTAQQEMGSVLGDMNIRQQNDFSKIQARFATRMPLSSSDVAEVIQRRLLAKTEGGKVELSNLYAREENNLPTLFGFADGSIQLKNYRDETHFINSYPFPPYQYTLFQMAIKALSEHNAFEGKHSSVGERSMLGVFQEVAKRLKDYPVGGVASFDMMFEGIRSALKGSVQQSIQIAEKQIEDIDPYAIRVLKALFLVKYVKEFKASARNISVLLLTDFKADQTEQRRKIESALASLERQTLIQRNGEVYEFLTNEEVDVQNEIKSLDVDNAEMFKELEAMIFDDTIKVAKIKHLLTGYEYPFSRMLDDRILNREQELRINIISPWDDGAGSPETVRSRSMATDELAIVMPQNATFMQDLRLILQKDKFLRQASTAAQQDGRSRIIGEIREQMGRNKADLRVSLHKLLADARFFVRGDELEISGEDQQHRIMKAFQTLVDKVYTNLPMLRQQSYSENDIAKVMKDDSGFFGAEGMSLTEPQQEILNYANSQGRIGGRVTAKSLIEHFGKKPFGWPVNAVLTNTAALVARSKLEAASDGVQLEGNDLVQGLRNSNLLSNIILTPQAEFQPSQIKKLREFYKEFFGSPLDGSDAKVIGAETAKAFEELATALRTLLAEVAQFPFLQALQEVMPLLEQVNRKPATWYLTDLSPFEDKLLDANDDIITPIRSFMGGPQKAIYAEVSRFLIDQTHNFGFINAPEIETLRTALADPDFYRNKSKMDLKVLYLEIKNKLELAIIAERDSAKAVIEGLKTKLQTLPQIADLTFDQRSAIDHRLNAAQSDLAGASQIALIRSKSHDAEATLYPSLVETVIQQAHANTAPKPAPIPGAGGDPAPAPVKLAPQTVRRKDITPEFNKSILSHEQDVEAYLDTLRTAYLAAIHSGKEIIV